MDSDLLAQAESLGVDIARACERGLAREISESRAQRWLEENKEAVESSNAYVDAHGLPLSEYRPF